MINGRRYGRSNLHQLPDKLKPLKVSTKENPDTVGFFGELCPFSNFYESEFMWNGHIYHSSEQYIKHQKAKFCGDTAAVNEILASKTALQCKQAARNIDNYNHEQWIYAETECLKVLLANFNQNPKIQSILLNTQNKTLVKCSWDSVWGTSCPLDKPHCLNPENWEGSGLLGALLMKVHDKLKQTDQPNPLLSTIPSTTSTDPPPADIPPAKAPMEIKADDNIDQK